MAVQGKGRQAESPGGSFCSPGGRSNAAEALLALADGSVWLTTRVCGSAPAIGAIDLVGEFVTVDQEEVATLPPSEARRLASYLASSERTSGVMHGCLAAPGATAPHHAVVALALAREEIGRP